MITVYKKMNDTHNDELALLASSGDHEALAQLWEQTFWFRYKIIKRYFPICSRYGLTHDDLMQESYFAFAGALRSYNPQKGHFIGLLGCCLHSTACKALGYRKKNPIIVSIDEPLSDSDNYAIIDSLSDESAETEIDNVSDNMLWEQFREFLEQCLKQLKPNEEYVTRARFYQNKTLKKIADEMGRTEWQIGIIGQQALQKLSKPRFSKKLWGFYNNLYS